MIISQYFTVTLMKAQLFFHVASIFVDIFLPRLDKGMYSVPGKVSIPPAGQLAHCILQCLIMVVMVPSLTCFFFFFLKGPGIL